jgi:hypothetical protein
VQTDTLSPERQKVVTAHTWRSHGDAEDIINDIEQREGAQPAPAPAPVPTATTPAPATTSTAPAATQNKNKNRKKGSGGQ